MSEERPDCFCNPDCGDSSCPHVHDCIDCWYDEWWYKSRGLDVPGWLIDKEKRENNVPIPRVD